MIYFASSLPHFVIYRTCIVDLLHTMMKCASLQVEGSCYFNGSFEEETPCKISPRLSNWEQLLAGPHFPFFPGGMEG